MDERSRIFLKKLLKNYYWQTEVTAPNEVYRREFGVGTFEDKIKFRHKSFRTKKELNLYLKSEAPYYISYSAAYYEFPAQPMDSKNWLGADLIFDLDKPMQYLSQKAVDEVTGEAKKLMAFLTSDFGIPEDDIRVNFSGSKGYHLHVVSDDVRDFSADDRRQIIDYIAGVGLDLEYFMKTSQATEGLANKRGKKIVLGEKRVGPKSDSVGWGKRIYDVTKHVLSMSEEDLVKIKGIGPLRAKTISENRALYLERLEKGNWDAFWESLSKTVRDQILKRAIAVTDEDRQVTADVSRLIRLPDTIHGGSGLLAKSTDSLDGFNPLTDALAFGCEPVSIKIVGDVPSFDIGGQSYGPYKDGEELEVETYCAFYLLVKEKATLS